MSAYQQCLLSKGSERQTAWIETRGAQVGKSVELKATKDFWKVEKIYPGTVPIATITVLRDNWRHTRQATDI